MSEYDAKMRDASEREEQFRKRVQPDARTDTPNEIQTSLSTVSTESSPSFHTPIVDQSPNVVSHADNKLNINSSPLTMENSNNIKTFDVIPQEETQLISKPIEKPIIRHTATEETTQEEYRRTTKYVPSNVLKSTIQNYMMDHNPLDEEEGKRNNI